MISISRYTKVKFRKKIKNFKERVYSINIKLYKQYPVYEIGNRCKIEKLQRRFQVLVLLNHIVKFPEPETHAVSDVLGV